MSNSKIELLAKLITGIVLLTIFIVPIFGLETYLANFTEETITASVIDNERLAAGDSSQYLVFTEGEVFKNSDSLWFWKFDSSDLQGQIRPGKTYELRVYGWRWPFFSMYRNIVSAKEVQP